MYHPIISIIVPVYNAEQYLKRCLSSIVSQSFKYFEILLINDGSTDGSFEICQKFAKADSRIRFFNRSNHGISATRQFGIDNAVGKYCIHVDSDDWIDFNYLEALYNEAQETSSDMVCAPFKKEYEGRTSIVRLYKPATVEGYIRGVCTGRSCGMVWNKLISLDIVRHNNVQFPIGVSMWEDLAFILKYLLFVRKISFVDNTYYHYSQYNINSLCKSSFSYDVISHTVGAVSNVIEFYRDRKCYDKYLNYLYILELFSKQKLLFDSTHRNIKQWFSIYPKSNLRVLEFFYHALFMLLYRTY